MAKNGKNRESVIEVLNKARADELGAIHQYMSLHYELAGHDYGPLAADLKLIAIDEMRHAEAFAERIHAIGGTPTSKPAAETRKNLPVREAYKFLVEAEEAALHDYNEYLSVCREKRDSLSAALFERILEEEQIHFDHFQAIARHLQDLGDTYLAKIAGGPADTGVRGPGFVAMKRGAKA